MTPLLTQPKGETMNSDGKSKLIVYAEHDGKLWAREYTKECVLEYQVDTAPA
jgi:hypothetical protein